MKCIAFEAFRDASCGHSLGHAKEGAPTGHSVDRSHLLGSQQRTATAKVPQKAQVAARPDLLGDPGVTVFQSAKSHVTGRAVDIPRTVGDRKITGREAATQFLGDVTALAVLAVGAGDLEIVATTPVETFDAYRDWLVREVGDGLGATRLRVVDEATAAAVGYQARMSPGDAFCVFDFGAGTLDISVVLVQEPDAAGGGSGVRTIAKSGLDLGGNHIDALLAEWPAGQAGLAPGDAVAWNRVFRRLLVSAEAAKVALTGRDRAVIEATDPVTGARYRARITRPEFERLLRGKDILGRAGRGLRKALDVAAARGYPADAISAVFLVGGSSLIPAVQDLLRMQFDPAIVHLDRPLEAVAAGAAGIAGGQGHPRPAAPPRHRGLRARARHLPGRQCRPGDHVRRRRRSAHRDRRRQEHAMLWLNEDSPTFLIAEPPADPGADRFRLDFRIDAAKRLTVSAFDLVRQTWVLDRQPVVRLA